MLAGFEVAHADEAPRTEAAEGIAVTTLQDGTGGEPSMMLVEFAPGATFGEELHHTKEILYVLEGEFHDGERVHRRRARSPGGHPDHREGGQCPLAAVQDRLPRRGSLPRWRGHLTRPYGSG